MQDTATSVAQDTATSISQSSARPAFPLNPQRVLLVEDDPEYGRIVERALSRSLSSFRVSREDRLDSALSRLELEQYDAMIVDLNLPDVSGRATLGFACAFAEHLPVLVLTGSDDETLALDATRAGAQDYLVKHRTHALTLPGAVVRAIERHRRGVRARRPLTAKPARVGTAWPASRVENCVDEVLLLDRLDRAISRARRCGGSVAVLVAGYDDLELLAEVLDARAVDALIELATLRLARRIRHSDTLARLASRRFALVVENSQGDGKLWTLAEKLAATLQSIEEAPLRGSQVTGFITRVGISTYPADGDDAETLLENAEAAAEKLGAAGGVGFWATPETGVQ